MHRVIPAWAGNRRQIYQSRPLKPGHPRVGGEQAALVAPTATVPGSSPRGRGTAALADRHLEAFRVIPAWAGNRPSSSRLSPYCPGHPRVGGEQVRDRSMFWRNTGSSPRGRGTGCSAGSCEPPWRVIPAWAGNSPERRHGCGCHAGHPRVGGEQMAASISASGATGSSPRGRGTGLVGKPAEIGRRVIPAWAGNSVRDPSNTMETPGHPRVGGEQLSCQRPVMIRTGSSPRGRGTDVNARRKLDALRVIPAWAGNSQAARLGEVMATGHPRVGGEQNRLPAANCDVSGSSPRGRGTEQISCRELRRVRVIPAWAGNSCQEAVCAPRTPGHPRVGGEQAVDGFWLTATDGSSPRGRGTDIHQDHRAQRDRVIPAWAGNSQSGSGFPRAEPGHPRVGGEQPVIGRPSAMAFGSSPRGRGTVHARHHHAARRRVIPAWAGNRRVRRSASRRMAGHPRVGGEQTCSTMWARATLGSSPRGRGTVTTGFDAPATDRVIPAWAGNRRP